LDDDNQNDASQDKRIQLDTTEMACQIIAAWTRDGSVSLLPISLPSTVPVPHQDLCSKEMEGKEEERDRKTVSSDVGSGEKLIKEEAKDACARPHSGIRLSVIDEVNEDSMEVEDNNKRNKTGNQTTHYNEEVSIGGSRLSVPSLANNCKGGINSAIGGCLLLNSRLSPDTFNEDSNDSSTSGIH
jgi:hypothetical protein